MWPVVANSGGMIQPGANDNSVVHATVGIDMEAALRAALCHGINHVCSITEILELVKAIQTSDPNEIVADDAQPHRGRAHRDRTPELVPRRSPL
jgi:alkyl hydroperoxide reductase subunit AhpC